MVTSLEAMWRNSCGKGYKNSLNNTSLQFWAAFRSLTPSPSLPQCLAESPNPNQILEYPQESQVTPSYPLWPGQLCHKAILIGRKLTGHRRWTQVSCVRGSSCIGTSGGCHRKRCGIHTAVLALLCWWSPHLALRRCMFQSQLSTVAFNLKCAWFQCWFNYMT